MNKILLEVQGLSYSHSQSGAYALIIGEKGSKTCIPIIIGATEAQSIAIAIEKIDSKRPLTHDLFKTIAESFEISIKEVIINRFKEGIFFSEIYLIKDDKEVVIDARPSDAIAIALRFNAPIFTYNEILEEVGIAMDDFINEDEDENNFSPENKDKVYDIKELEDLLQDAIENEDYASASKLRDLIKERKQ